MSIRRAWTCGWDMAREAFTPLGSPVRPIRLMLLPFALCAFVTNVLLWEDPTEE